MPDTIPSVRIGGVSAIGWRAHAALRAGGAARVLAVLSSSIYIDADGAVLWVGDRDATPHARAVHVDAAPAAPATGAWISVAVGETPVPWRPVDGVTTRDAA